MERDPVSGMYVRESFDSYRCVGLRKGPTYVAPVSHNFGQTERVDAKIQWSGQGLKTFHSCIHDVERVDPVGRNGSLVIEYGAQPTFGTGKDGVAFVQGSTIAAPSDWGVVNLNLPSVTYPDPGELRLDWSSAREHLLEELEGRMTADNSFAQNIVEFRQVLNLHRSLAKPFNDLVKWCKHGPYRKARIRVRRHEDIGGMQFSYTQTKRGYFDNRVSLESLRWGLKDLSGSWLATQFGLKPLISDVGNFVTKYWQLKNHLMWHKLVSTGKPVHFFARTPVYSRNIVVRELDTSYASNWAYPIGAIPVHLTARSNITGYGVLGCTASISPKSDSLQLSALLASALGVNAPLQTVWDLIPFSFVADWFFPVGETLQRVDARAFGRAAALSDKFIVHQRWHSIKSTLHKGWHRAEQHFEKSIKGYNNQPTKVTMSEGSLGTFVTHYERFTGWPDLTFLPPFQSEWSVVKSLSSAALILQRLLRRPGGRLK